MDGAEQTFEFKLTDMVRLVMSNEYGEVIGRGEFAESKPKYFIRYLRADGVQVEAWWSVDAVMKA